MLNFSELFNAAIEISANVWYPISIFYCKNAMMKSAADICERTENDRFAETVRVTLGVAFRFGAAEINTAFGK